MASSRLRLRSGLRVSGRGDTALQVGLHPGHRLVLPDTSSVRATLRLLTHGVERRRLDHDQHDVVQRLCDAGLLVDPDSDLARARTRQQAHVEVVADGEARATLLRMLADAGLGAAHVRSPGKGTALAVLVALGSEQQRAAVDAFVQADRSHLLVTAVAGRLRVGPFVVPGVTACLRCLDEHVTDRDPRHPLIVEQHLTPDTADRPAAAELQLALAWAARDVAIAVGGDRPTTWSATVDLEPDGPQRQQWPRHPRCGCAWADALTG